MSEVSGSAPNDLPPPASDPVAQRRAELARRLAALSPEKRAQLAQAPGAPARGADRPATIPRRDPALPVPMSYAQELLFRLERASPGHAYNVPRAVRLGGVLDQHALQRALDTLVARHESLRTTLDLVNDAPVQIVHPPAPVVIQRINVSDEPEDKREQAARAHMRELARKVFDLSADTQLQAWLFRLADDDHVLFLLSHHVSSDGWSANIIMRELTRLYSAFRDNQAPDLPAVPLQYGDYAAWQRKHLSGARLETLLHFWREQMAGAPRVPNFPTDRPRGGLPTFEGGIRGRTLPLALLNDARTLAREENATLFMVLLATLYVLIYRYGGDEELVVGTPIAGRPYPETEQTVGFFSNTLLLRASLGNAPSFRQLLAQVRNRSLAAFDNQDVPLETLLTTNGSDGRPIASMPSFVLSTDDPDRVQLRLEGATAKPMREAFGSTKFDVLLSAAETPAGLKLGAEFRTELFDGTTIERLLEHFGVLLAGAVATPDAPIGRLPLLSGAERAQLTHTWSDTAVAYPPEATLVSLFDAQVQRSPNAAALQFGNRTLTYAQLDAAASGLALKLITHGAAPSVLVGVCAERSLELVVALLAVLKSGAAYVPLDPDYPPDRLAFMLADSSTPVILAQQQFVGVLGDATVLLLDDVLQDADATHTAPLPAPSPDDAAYMIYTSGSTGRPKGALNSHRGIVNRLLWMQDQYQLTAADAVLQKTPFSFDVSVWEFFWPLLAGAKLVIAAPGGHRDPVYLAREIAARGITVTHFVPSMLRAFLAGAPAGTILPSLRHVMASGEALTPDIVPAFRTMFSGALLHNLYGPTECAVDVTHWTVPAQGEVALIPIGRPVANTQMHVLDTYGEPTPIGVAGELHIGGVQVGMGYHNRPDLTAEKFVRDHRSSVAGARLYRTGDSARWLPDGTIEYLGRLDFQVKLRGFRIELGEIESVIKQHAEVADAIAIVREDTPGDQRLVAYVVPHSAHAALRPTDLRDAVRRVLPEHMVPSHFVHLDRMPLTASGKTDRKALPAPAGATGARPYQSPRSTIEHELAQIWERLLSPGRRISAFDDFFEIGGHSLLAIRMLAEVERVRGQRVPLAWLFESSTVAGLAARLNEQMLAAEEPPVVVLQAQGTDPAVAFVHGDWTGGGWYVRRLAPLVSAQSPFFVLPTLGGENDNTPWSIELMAARHVAELRKLQPRGPYRVIGYCVGGMVAFEIACQLQAAGERVERLVLIDSSPMNAKLLAFRPVLRLLPGSNASERLSRQAAVLRRMRWAAGRIAFFRQLPKGAVSPWIVQKVTVTLPRLVRNRLAPQPHVRNANDVHSTARTATVSALLPGANTAALLVADETDRDTLLLRSQARAASAYIPRRFHGQLDFVFAEGAPGAEPRVNPVGRWRNLVDDVRVHSIPSGHISLITDNLPRLAEILAALLAEGAPARQN